MEPSRPGTESEHEPVAANPFGGTPPWQRSRINWKRTLAGLGALALTAGAISSVAWLAFRDTDGGGAAAGERLSERCGVVASDDAGPGADAPDLGAPADRSIVTIETSHGDLDVMLWGDLAPCGVEAFVHLAQTGFYDRHECDRLTTQPAAPSAILRCGATEDAPGPGWRFRAEVGMAGNDVVDVLALVTDENGNAGSAFTLIRGQAVPTAGVSIIGGIVDGYEVLDTIAALPETTEFDGAPPQPVTIHSITITGASDAPDGDAPGTESPDTTAPSRTNDDTPGADGPGAPTGNPADGAEPS